MRSNLHSGPGLTFRHGAGLQSMRRISALLLGLLASCVAAPVRSSDKAPDDATVQQSSNSCFTDTDCPGGSCRLGECSPIPPEPAFPPPQPTVGTPCTSGVDCSDNLCQGADCH
jgi:hypothetical protein